MTATNAEMLEGLLSTSINTQYSDTPPDEAEFNAKVDELPPGYSDAVSCQR